MIKWDRSLQTFLEPVKLSDLCITLFVSLTVHNKFFRHARFSQSLELGTEMDMTKKADPMVESLLNALRESVVYWYSI